VPWFRLVNQNKPEGLNNYMLHSGRYYSVLVIVFVHEVEVVV
jgi:hypothetical protein